MAAVATQNGHTNGLNNGIHVNDSIPLYPRFGDIPAVIDIPLRGEDGEEVVGVDLSELQDDTIELCDLLENEDAAGNYWITIALAYAKQDKVNIAIHILRKAEGAMRREDDRLPVLSCLCWMHLWKCRHAPRVKPTQPAAQQNGDGAGPDERTKEVFLHEATTILNQASKISPSYPPLFLARGTLYLLRAPLQPTKSGPTGRDERTETLKQALKCFDDSLRVSNGRNIFALLGKAKTQFSMSNVPAALSLYQQALERAPDMLDPDPRIGIGCCLWTLGYKELAQSAWQRSLDLNPGSQIANILLGLYYLDEANKLSPSTDRFREIYGKAMTTHTQTSFKFNPMHALTCATFGHYFVARKNWAHVERLARRAIELTDTNAIASDGWYLLARKDHFEGEWAKAMEEYSKSDMARGGDERGFVPAKFGNAQLRILQGDIDGGKFRLEKIVEKGGRGGSGGVQQVVEAMTLLGILFAEDVFFAQTAGSKEDKGMEAKKAIAMFEAVRTVWKDVKRNSEPDTLVLLNLARLYENDSPEKALACLQEVEKMEISNISEDDLPDEMGDEDEERRIRRELLAPQLLNNIGCFHFQAEKFVEAREDFQVALSACVKQGDRLRRQQENGENGTAEIDGLDADATDALVSTISYNLARTYEAESIDDEAQKVYQGLLERHPDYMDARIRLAYLALKANPAEGGEAIKALLDSDPANLDVRALYGYYIHTAKRKTLALNEDVEQKHYKQTLQSYDKHDLYSLTGMGNLHLTVAREMKRDTDQEKDRRSKMYVRAVEFFDKVLTLDPKNAFAAQGMGIAIVEERRDSATGIQIFSKVKESVKDGSSVHVNLGHVFTEVKQYSRAIENYELALIKSRDSARDPGILACLGRVWLIRGRQEKKLEAYKTSLDFSRQALEAAPENLNYRFNVAFVRIQLAQMIISLPEAQKTLQDVEDASAGLDQAIETFGRIAREPNPPFPRGDIEQRASMGRNTMKRQLASAVERQREYEEKNRERLEDARRKRLEEIARREQEKKAAAETAEEKRRKIREERERIAEEDRLLVERRLEEEKAKEAELWTTDEETGDRRKREKRPKAKKKRKNEDSDDEGLEGTPGVDGEGARSRQRSGVASSAQSDAEGGRRKTKKRKLEQRKGRATTSSKYKSADVVEDSDEDDLDGVTTAAAQAPTSDADNRDGSAMPETPGGAVQTPGVDEDDMQDEEEEQRIVQRASQRKKAARVLDDEDDEELDEGDGRGERGVAEAGGSDHGGDGIGEFD